MNRSFYPSIQQKRQLIHDYKNYYDRKFSIFSNIKSLKQKHQCKHYPYGNVK